MTDSCQTDFGTPYPAGAYVPFVRQVAMRMVRRLPSHVCIDDLVGAGMVGLLEAKRRYNPEVTGNFERYAEFRVKGAMLDELRRRDVMARDARTRAKRIDREVVALTGRLGRPPEETELSHHLDMEVDELRRTLNKLTPVRMVELGEHHAQHAAGDAPSPFESVARAELLEQLAEAIRQLSERQQQVLQLYYREELTLREIGEVLGVSESRVCQIVSAITSELRELMGLSEGIPGARGRVRRGQPVRRAALQRSA